MSIEKNDIITLTRLRDNAVRSGEVEGTKVMNGRTMIILAQPGIAARGKRYGNYYCDECTIVSHHRS